MSSYEWETGWKQNTALSWTQGPGIPEMHMCVHTHPSNTHHLAQFTEGVMSCPSTSAVRIFPLSLDNLPSHHLAVNHKLQPFQHYVLKFKVFLRQSAMFIVLWISFFFFFQLESGHCLLTDQIIVMADTLVQPSIKTIDLVFPAASVSTFYKIHDLFLHSPSWRR